MWGCWNWCDERNRLVSNGRGASTGTNGGNWRDGAVVAREIHTLKAGGSSPPPATYMKRQLMARELVVTVKQKPARIGRVKLPVYVKYDIDMAAIARHLIGEDMDVREHVLLLCFNSQAELLGYYRLGVGGINAVMADRKLLFGTALGCGAYQIALVHNHPSGNLTFSRADKKLQEAVANGCKLMELALMDFMIVTSNGHRAWAGDKCITKK